MPTCDPLSLHIADALDRRRRLLGLSQKALAQRIGVTEGATSRRLDGHSMRTSTIHKLAAALDAELRVELVPRTQQATRLDEIKNSR